MATRKLPELQLYRRNAIERFEDAQALLRAGRTTGAVYLAGYSVECSLKALILSTLPLAEIPGMLGSFRGPKAHDYGWLRYRYRLRSRADLPREISQAFSFVGAWSTNMRYEPGPQLPKAAQDFLAATELIIEWANRRL